ncbi:MAG: hypothetical protein GC136_00515 [Alphaproteobacteria bacterium]|nr:hypothetical protein [Alphaproteobacteria bacterium]
MSKPMPAEKRYPSCVTDMVIKKFAKELLVAGGITRDDKEKFEAEQAKYTELLEHYYITEFAAPGAGYENPFVAFSEAVSKKILQLRG